MANVFVLFDKEDGFTNKIFSTIYNVRKYLEKEFKEKFPAYEIKVIGPQETEDGTFDYEVHILRNLGENAQGEPIIVLVDEFDFFVSEVEFDAGE